MENSVPRPNGFFPTRRQLLARVGTGLGGVALATLLGETSPGAMASGLQGANPGGLLAARPPHFKPRAKHVIHLFMNGGPSQVDTFDPKPELTRWHGKPLPFANLRTEGKTGAAMGSPFSFRKCGQSGIEVSELFPHVRESIDDICVIRSMVARLPNHESGLRLMNTGEDRFHRPAMGAWLTYGLGTENQNLPGFVVLCPDGLPVDRTRNWQSSFLPGVFQGMLVDTKHHEIDKLVANIRNPRWTLQEQRRQLDLIGELNRRHLAVRDQDSQLESRIESFELAYRMQLEAADAFDVSREPQHILDMYGEGTQGRQMLIARRLVERGVRFVQTWHGKDQPWDSHSNVERDHAHLARQSDQPIAALLRDLKQRGLLEETIVLWGGEFGRTPTVELSQFGEPAKGRDHNHWGFSVWLAGGGIQGGITYGATDEFGYRTVDKPVEVHDLHATILHQMGLDHEQLTYRYAGRDFRLTDVYGKVVDDIIS